MQLSLFGRTVEVQKPPEKPAEVADITWEQFTAWRKAPFDCEWCGKPASHAGCNVKGPWRVHLACERAAAVIQMADVMKEARRLARDGQ
jgi:hypothetical protein